MNNKKGNIIASLGIIITIVIILSFFLLYYQINTISNSIRKDLFYISNNLVIGMDKEELFLGNYKINIDKSKTIIESLLKKNHIKGYVKDIIIEKISFDKDDNKIIVHITINVKFVPLIAIGSKREYHFKLKDDTRISLLMYN